jgi:hypothetical protein
MRRKDLAIFAVVGFFSAIASILISNFIFNSPSSHALTAPTVEKIDAAFQDPPVKYINANSINPTKLIQIGDGSNNAPFVHK